MHSTLLISFLGGLLARGVSAACSSALLIDNFSQFSSNTNSLGSWTSDDGTMTSISAANNVLSLKPKSASSYFYESFDCQAASSNGYNSLQFTIKGPSGGSFSLELQTKSSCSATSYSSYYYAVTGLTGSTQTVTVPFSSFSGANANAITAITWGDFSSTTTTWELSKVQFGCSGAISSTSKTSSTSSTTGTSVTTSSSTTKITSSTTLSSATGACTNLLIDDWASQSRLTFLYYNAMMQPSSDDGTMNSVVVSGNRVTLTPTNTQSYFYSQFGCLNAKGTYGGISLRIKAAAGTSISVDLSYTSTCGGTETTVSLSASQLGWTFDGTEKLYSIPFSKFTSLDTSKLQTILFRNLNRAVTLGPMAFYCGSTVSEYTVPTTTSPGTTSTVPAPTGTAAALVIDKFGNKDTNTLGFWHGADDGMTLTWGTNQLTIQSTDADYSFYTQVTGTCRDMTSYDGSYLHIAYSGSTSFTVALQQHNSACDENIAPYPETWDSLEASRYAKNGHIYIPMNHFNINKGRVIGIALKGFYSTTTVTLTTIEIVKAVPAGTTIPSKLPSGQLMFACKRPNSFAFAIDDGSPEYAQEVLQIIKEEGIKVTFFTVGAPLLDPTTNLTNVYKEMKAAGHQIALHSYTHPKMEGLPDIASIDWEYNNDLAAVKKQLGDIPNNIYFRPPFGTEGARMRERFAVAAGNDNPYIVNWSVDVEDWLWAETSTPEKQLDAFNRDVNKGGNLVVMHYLYPTTVSYLRQFIQIAKATGKQLMRVDQCMMDPNAPAL